MNINICTTINTTTITNINHAVIFPSQYHWQEIVKHHSVWKKIMVENHDVMPHVAKHHGDP